MSNQSTLINARLFEKGVRDALAGLTEDITFTKHPSRVAITVSYPYDGRELKAVTAISEELLEASEGHLSLGKSIGFKMAHRLLVEVCEAQPQEITLSIKDISKARDKDNRVARPMVA